MNDGLLLGIDIGTTTSKAVLVTADGKLFARTGIEHSVSRPQADWAEHDADKVWWHDVVSLCRTLLERTRVSPFRIRAVSVSGLYPVIVPVSADGAPLRPAILYGIDKRASEEIRELEQMVGNEYSITVSGNRFSSQSIAPKLLWLKHHEPEIFERTAKYLFATGYINYKLTGKFVADHGSASLCGLPYDIGKGSWDVKVLDYIGVAANQLPELVWAGENLGHISAKAAEETGLSRETAVIAGTSDHAAETLALGGSMLGYGVLSYGTTFGVDVCTDQLQVIEGLTVCGTGFPNRYLIGGGMAGGASITKWFCEEFGREELQRQEEGGMNAYQQLSKLAASTPPGAENLIALPYFSGERCPIYDPDAVGVLYGLTLRHSRGHIYRSLLESVGYGARQIKELLEENNIDCSKMMAVGGGARSDLWCQIISDILDVEQMILYTTNGSSMGDAMIAGLGIGLYQDLSECRGWNEVVGKVKPQPENQAIYNRNYHIFRDLYKVTKNLELSLRKG